MTERTKKVIAELVYQYRIGLITEAERIARTNDVLAFDRTLEKGKDKK